MNINYSRYMDSVGVGGMRKNTFLNNWSRKAYGVFYQKYADDFNPT